VILFLYGPDSFRSKQKLQEIVLHYKTAKKSGLNLRYIDAEQVAFDEFYSLFRASSMFDEKKLVVVKNLFSNKAFQEALLAETKKESPLSVLEKLQDVVVVYESGEVDQRLKIGKALLKAGKCQEFALLDPKQCKAWATTEAEKLGVKINLDALDLLVAWTGNDLWRLSNELQKLANYKRDSVIQKKDVELLVRPKLEQDIFKTIDALAQKDKRQALALLHRHLDFGEAPLYLLSMVAYQFKNLLSVKELAQQGLMYNSIVKRSGLHPFVVKKNYFQCNQFQFQELKHMYHAIYQADVHIKTGQVEPETALDMLVSKI